MIDLGVDPASLVALHVLLEERHVTRAARQLGITQSSMSHRLQGLRASLGDPLLVRGTRGLVLTPRAQAMVQPLAAALRDLHTAIRPSPQFSPEHDAYVLTLAMPDLLMPLVPVLLRALAAAPYVQLRLQPMPASLADTLQSGAPVLALAPVAHAGISLMSRSLGELRFGVVTRKGHPLAAQRVTLKRWLAYEHVVVGVGNASPNVIGEALRRRGLERRIGLQVPSFLAGLWIVAHSDAVMNAPMPLVHEVSRSLPLEVRSVPVALPRVPFAMLWDPGFSSDPAHRWCRDVVYETVRTRLQSNSAR